MKTKLYSIALCLFVSCLLVSANAEPGTFTYQGRLTDGGVPAAGSYDLRAILYTAAIGGSQIGPIVTTSTVSVEAGVFSVELDFGPGAFNGEPRWLELSVRHAGVEEFTRLDPRQPILGAPFAQFALTPAGPKGETGAAGPQGPQGRPGSADAWSRTGNAGTSPGANFLGTSDSQALVVKTTGTERLRVTADGNVGIGTSTPAGKLEVSGTVTATSFNGTFSGNGAALTSLNAANITTGILPAARIDEAITRDNEVLALVEAVDGSGSGLDADKIDGLDSTAFWKLGGNTGTDPGTDFLGTTDNQALELKVNGRRAVRLEPTPNDAAHLDIVNVVLGAPGNLVSVGKYGATIGGGGAGKYIIDTLPHPNMVLADFGTVSGGIGNSVSGPFSSVTGGYNNSAGGDSSTVGGGSGNSAGANGATVGGGQSNAAGGDNSTISGGIGNGAAGPGSVVGGGSGNKAGGTLSVIAGGAGNVAIAVGSTVAGGTGNVADANSATVGGGTQNHAAGDSSTVGGGFANAAGTVGATVGGGNNNGAAGTGSTIGGGGGNVAHGQYSTIAGGTDNRASGTSAFVAGGEGNLAAGSFSAIGGGIQNSSPGPQSTVSGGHNNVGSGSFSTVGGGNSNTAAQSWSTVGGGIHNTADHEYSTVSGGQQNWAVGTGAFVGGGYGNYSSGVHSFVGGGEGNSANGNDSVIPGGFQNAATGFASFAAGAHAKALHAGAFVWADDNVANFVSTAPNQFCVRARGGVQLDPQTSIFFGAETRQMLNLWNNVYGIGIQANRLYFRSADGFAWFEDGVHNDATDNPGDGGAQLMRLTSSGLTVNGVSITSDRNAKENFESVDSRAILDKVVALPLSEWSFKTDGSQSRHLGPMAQDFKAAFNLGADDKHIATVDADGVALAAIQGLNDKVEAENAALRGELRSRDTRIAALEQSVAELKALASGLALAAKGTR